MSTNTIDHEREEPVTNINGIGSTTASLLSATTVAELAQLTTEEAVEQTAEKNKSIDENVVKQAVRRARQGLGFSPAVVPEFTDGEEHSSDDNEGNSDESGGGPSSIDEMASSMMADVQTEPDDKITVCLVAGNDSFESELNKAKLNAEEFNAAGTVSRRLYEAGMLGGNGLEFDELVLVDREVGSSAGAEWGLKWIQHIRGNTDFEIPEVTFVSLKGESTEGDGFEMVGVGADSEERRDWESGDWAEAYASRRNEALGRANMLVVVENGDGVGRWISGANTRGVEIDAPEYKGGSNDSDSDSDDSDSNDSDSDGSGDDDNDGNGGTAASTSDEDDSDDEVDEDEDVSVGPAPADERPEDWADYKADVETEDTSEDGEPTTA